MCDAANRATDAAGRCGCEAHVENRHLVVDATNCVAAGRLSTSAACRRTVIAALVGRPAVSVRTRIDGGQYVHDELAVGLLVAAARFVEFVNAHDEALAARTLGDPLGAAREAVGRGGRVGRLAAETGLCEGAWRVAGNAEAFGVERELNPLTSAGPTRSMLHDVETAGELSPEQLRARYDQRLRAVVETHGVETVAGESGVARESVAALAGGDSPSLTLDDAAAILAVSDGEPDAETVVAETRDHLLLGMTTAVLDVEAVESGIDGALDAREIQQKIEGRLPMTLDELATIHGHIEERKP